MRYQYSTLVLATLTVGQAVAGTLRHAHFHARKHAEPLEVDDIVDKREAGLENVDWSKVAYTYSAGQTWGEQTAAAAVVPTTPTTTATLVSVTKPAVSAATSASSSAEDSSSKETADVEPSAASLTPAHASKLVSLRCKFGINAVSNNGAAWIGTDGPYTNEFTNASGEDLILVIWGPAASWVTDITPLITVSLSSGASITISFATGLHGAWSTIREGIEVIYGQVHNTWGEFAFEPEGVVDVSKEVNMNGHSMKIVGPDCTADMDTCVFVCPSGDTCTTGYELRNCAKGSQDGAKYGEYKGAPSGGCGWKNKPSASLKTTLY